MSKLLINQPPLQFQPALAVALGVDEAIAIQQLHYWLENPKSAGRIDENGVKWVYNTYEEWKENNFPFWSVDKIQRIFLSLEKLGVVISAQLDAKKHDMRKFYRIDYDQICAMDDAVLRPSNTAELHDVNKVLAETTTENPLTPENLAQANAKVTAIVTGQLGPKAIQDAMAKFFKLTPRWEGNKFNREWMQWAIEEGITPEQIEKAADKWRMDKGFNWRPPDLKAIQEKWLMLIDSDKASNLQSEVTDDAHGSPMSW